MQSVGVRAAERRIWHLATNKTRSIVLALKPLFPALPAIFLTCLVPSFCLTHS